MYINFKRWHLKTQVIEQIFKTHPQGNFDIEKQDISRQKNTW